MRAIALITAALLTAAPALAQAGHSHAEHGAGAHQHTGEHASSYPAGVLPEGWEARLDRPGPMDNVRFVSMHGHLHATLGPSAIFYNPTHVATGTYRVEGTFNQLRATSHPEAYGLLVGGLHLDGEGQDYLYFLVRQDGRFLVKHRAGAETHTLIDWTEHSAVRPLGADGRAVNRLAVDVQTSEVRFLVNDTEVGTLPRVSYLNTDGIYGLRINHGLDVMVEGFGVVR